MILLIHENQPSYIGAKEAKKLNGFKGALQLKRGASILQYEPKTQWFKNLLRAEINIVEIKTITSCMWA